VTPVSPEDLEAFVQVFEASDWDRAYLCVDGVDLCLSRVPGSRAVNRQGAPTESIDIVAPHVATFHRGSAPGAAPYVEVGQSVREGTELGRLAVLRNFWPVRAAMAGVVREICAIDGALVEFDQVLIRIDPVS
jgi:acetyl-CoA carboxylase biotin carboxyl carrier protein